MDRAGEERGATAVTYAVMVAILALLLVGGVMVLSGSIEMALNDGANCVANIGDCGDSGSSGGGNGGGGTTSTTNGSSTTTSTTSAGGP